MSEYWKVTAAGPYGNPNTIGIKLNRGDETTDFNLYEAEDLGRTKRITFDSDKETR